jgi:hypothetical protein
VAVYDAISTIALLFNLARGEIDRRFISAPS